VLTPLIGMNGLVDAAPPEDGKALAAEVHELAKRETSAYTIRLEGSDRPLTLRPEPIIKWGNPVAGTVFGEIFVWTDQGRPEVVVSSYRFYKPDPHRTNEFQSLATRRLSAERDGAVVWAPSRPGLDMKVIAGTAAPGASAAVRLRQMRALAQEFTGRDTNHSGVEREMRLLTQPVYRYEKPEGDLIDGAMFAFALGTDPEVFLLLEARQPKTGAPEWRFGAARMNSITLRINHRGREVWTAPALSMAQVRDHTEPYTAFRFETK
jgi:hypothetical protein